MDMHDVIQYVKDSGDSQLANRMRAMVRARNTAAHPDLSLRRDLFGLLTRSAGADHSDAYGGTKATVVDDSVAPPLAWDPASLMDDRKPRDRRASRSQVVHPPSAAALSLSGSSLDQPTSEAVRPSSAAALDTSGGLTMPIPEWSPRLLIMDDRILNQRRRAGSEGVHPLVAAALTSSGSMPAQMSGPPGDESKIWDEFASFSARW